METYQATEQLLSKIQQPTEKVKLPSTVGTYSDEIIQVDEDGLLEVSPMVTEDERLFAAAASFTDGSGIFNILKKRVKGCLKPELLYEPDVEFLISAIRALTFSSEYESTFKCEHCYVENTAIINSNELLVKTFSADDINKSVTLSNGQIVNYVYLTAQQGMRLNSDDDNLKKYIAKIASVDGIQDKHAIDRWFRALPIKIQRELTPLFKEELGGFQTSKIPVNCEKCGKENTTSISLIAGFFIQVLGLN